MLAARSILKARPYLLYEAATKSLEQLTTEIQGQLELCEDIHDPQITAQYLAEEVLQAGDRIILSSTETGYAIGALDPSYLEEQPRVMRENGRLGIGLPRLKPEVEAALTLWFSDRGREKGAIDFFSARLGISGLDTRLLILSRNGRQAIATAIGQLDPTALLDSARGILREFWSRLQPVTTEPDTEPSVSGQTVSGTDFGISDLLALSVVHQHASNTRASLAAGVLREMARLISVIPGLPSVSSDSGPGFWIAPPEAVSVLLQKNPLNRVLPVVGAQTVSLSPSAGRVKIDSYSVSSRESGSVWAVYAKVHWRVWLHGPTSVRSYPLDVDPDTQVVHRSPFET